MSLFEILPAFVGYIMCGFQFEFAYAFYDDSLAACIYFHAKKETELMSNNSKTFFLLVFINTIII